MAKSKYAPALFEVIDSHSKGKKKDSLALPKWWKNSTKEEESTPEQKSDMTPKGDVAAKGDVEPDRPSPVPAAGEAGVSPGAAQIEDQSSAREVASPPPSETRSEEVGSGTAATTPNTSVAASVPAASPTRSPRRSIATPAPLSRTGGRSPSAGADGGAGRNGGTGGATLWDRGTDMWNRVVRTEEGRVVFSLTPVNLCFVCGAMLIALLTAFLIGKSTNPTLAGERETVTEEDVNRDLGISPDSEADPTVLGRGSQTETPAERASGSAAGTHRERASGGDEGSPDRQVGLNYVILQYFKAEHREDAVHAQQWLASEGLETTLEPSAVEGGWLLISTRGFDYDAPNGKAAAEAFREDIIRLGKKYREEFGSRARYTFHDPMIRKEH